jgi:hypothetical protein
MRRIVLILALLSVSPRSQGAQPAPGDWTIDALIDIKHPSNPVWSPDGGRVAFVWNRAGVENVWLVDLSASKPVPPRARAHVLEDAWKRVERFFDQHLR